MRVPRTRGAVSGAVLVLLGIWGGLIPFIGPIFDYAYTPDTSWHYTTGRLFLEILPGAAAILGGLCLLGGANRLVTWFGGWLAAVAGAWFTVGQPLSSLWNGTPAAGSPVSSGATHAALVQIGFFTGLGVVIVFFAAVALGRMSVLGVKEVRRAQTPPSDEASAAPPRDIRRTTAADSGSDEAMSSAEASGRTARTGETLGVGDEERATGSEDLPSETMQSSAESSTGRTEE
ncbi:MAG: hypothetical protein ACRDQA_05060 [Nocardioidaceae bacterium]